MDQQESFKRAYATLTSLKANLPNYALLHERYVEQYHGALDKFEALGINVKEFRIPEDQFRQHFISNNYVTGGEKEYGDYREVGRSFFLVKLDSLLTYLSLSIGEDKTEMGFRQN